MVATKAFNKGLKKKIPDTLFAITDNSLVSNNK